MVFIITRPTIFSTGFVVYDWENPARRSGHDDYADEICRLRLGVRTASRERQAASGKMQKLVETRRANAKLQPYTATMTHPTKGVFACPCTSVKPSSAKATKSLTSTS